VLSLASYRGWRGDRELSDIDEAKVLLDLADFGQRFFVAILAELRARAPTIIAKERAVASGSGPRPEGTFGTTFRAP
jgi:hypothetical protein